MLSDSRDVPLYCGVWLCKRQKGRYGQSLERIFQEEIPVVLRGKKVKILSDKTARILRIFLLFSGKNHCKSLFLPVSSAVRSRMNGFISRRFLSRKKWQWEDHCRKFLHPAMRAYRIPDRTVPRFLLRRGKWDSGHPDSLNFRPWIHCMNPRQTDESGRKENFPRQFLTAGLSGSEFLGQHELSRLFRHCLL